MVVEDEYLLADDLATAIAACGAEVVGPVATADAALAVLAGGAQVDAAVLDIKLRDVSSYAVADALAARRIPFVFATGLARASVIAAHAEVPHWRKPYAATELIRSLTQALPPG